MAPEHEGKALCVGDRVRWAHPVHDKCFPEEVWEGTVKRVSNSGFSVLWDWAQKPMPYSWQFVVRGWVCRLPQRAA